MKQAFTFYSDSLSIEIVDFKSRYKIIIFYREIGQLSQHIGKNFIDIGGESLV